MNDEFNLRDHTDSYREAILRVGRDSPEILHEGPVCEHHRSLALGVTVQTHQLCDLRESRHVAPGEVSRS